MKIVFTFLLLLALSPFNSLHAQKFKNWIEVQRIKPFDSVQHSNYGHAVALSDSFAVVAATRDEVGNEKDTSRVFRSGAVYIYKKDKDQWIQWQKLLSFERGNNSLFGNDVIIDNERLIVGSFNHPNGSGLGKVFVYKPGQNKQWEIDQIIAPPDTTYYFGQSLAKTDKYLVIGSYADNNGTLADTFVLGAGAVYVYQKVNDKWEFKQKLTASKREVYDLLGHDVDIYDSTIIAGAHGRNKNTGVAYIFTLVNDSFVETLELRKRFFTEEQDEFGASVSVFKNYAAVSISGNDYNSNSARVDNIGGVFLFNLEDLLLNSRNIFPLEEIEQSYYGRDIVMSRDFMFIGSNRTKSVRTDTTRVSAGGVTVLFNNFFARQEIYAPVQTYPSNFGSAVAYHNDHIIVGAPLAIRGGVKGDSTNVVGAVYIYELQSVSGVESIEAGKAMQIFPNPAGSNIEVKVDFHPEIITIHDIYGRLVRSVIPKKIMTRFSIDISELQNGLYFVSAGQVCVQLLVQR